jgi:hypothetical protein
MTHIRSINEIETYSSAILHALKERRQSHAIAYMREMVEQFARGKVVKEMTRLLQQTQDKKTLLCGIPPKNKFALLMESCNQKNEIALEFILSAYPIRNMSSDEFSKFVAFMLTNKFDNDLIRNLLLQRNPETLVIEMNQALFYTININNKKFWLNPLSLSNVSLLFEFGANLCSHVMDLLKNSKALDAILYVLVCHKKHIDLSLVKQLIQAGADIFYKNLSISTKTIYEYLQNHLHDFTWLTETKYYEFVSHVISDNQDIPKDKLLNAIYFLLDGKTENPLRVEHIKYLRLINNTQLTDEEKKQCVAPLLLLQIHKARTIPELMTIVDLLKLHRNDFIYLTTTSKPNIIKIATKAIVCRIKAMAIIERQIIFPDDMSYQKTLDFLKSVSSYSLYTKHEQDFNTLAQGKIVITEKNTHLMPL